jgi:ketosteroid isomerase-like protein
MTTTETATSPTHLMSLFAQRAATGDVDGLMALYEPEAVFEPQLGTVLRSGQAIRAALTAFAAMRPTIEYTTAADCAIVGDIALVANTWTVTGRLPDGGTAKLWLLVPLAGRGRTVVRRRTRPALRPRLEPRRR